MAATVVYLILSPLGGCQQRPLIEVSSFTEDSDSSAPIFPVHIHTKMGKIKSLRSWRLLQDTESSRQVTTATGGTALTPGRATPSAPRVSSAPNCSDRFAPWKEPSILRSLYGRAAVPSDCLALWCASQRNAVNSLERS